VTESPGNTGDLRNRFSKQAESYHPLSSPDGDWQEFKFFWLWEQLNNAI
jgi:hypothetical protein